MTDPKRGIMVRKKTIQSDTGIEDTTAELYPGDTIDYGVTHEVELPDRTRLWLKLGATTSVQAGESAQQAADRLVAFTHGQIQDRVVQAVRDAGAITL